MSKLLKRDLIIVLLLVAVVVFIQYLLLQPVLKLGFSYEDWFMLDFFRVLGSDPLSKISYVIKSLGPYFIQEYWIGILVNIFGSQSPSLLKEVSISLKVIETLVIYPVVLLIFKRKLLAFLATLIFAMHYSATSSLEDIISGPDYLVGLSLLLFLAIYHHIIKNKILNLKWLSLLLLSLTATILSSPIRAYPALTLPFIIEMFVLNFDHSKSSLKNSFFRLLTLLPLYLLIIVIIMVFVFFQEKFAGENVSYVRSSILRGNWYLILHPVSSLSTLFLPPEYLQKVFGVEVFQNNLFASYVSFLIRKTLIFFGILAYLFSFLVKPSWLNRFKFVLITLVLNFVLDAATFFIYNHRYDNFANYLDPSTLVGMYTILLGIFLLILNFWAIYGWWKGGKRNNLLWAFWSGLTFSFIFVLLVRLIADEVFAYKTVHRYLLTASLGASLCLASLLTLLYDKITSSTSNTHLSRSFSNILIFLIFIAIYYTSNQQISNYFNAQLANGRSAQAQEMMHQKFMEKFSKYNYDVRKPSFFFFDVSGESNQNGLFFEDSFSSNFMYWMHLRNPKLVDGCIQNRVGSIDFLKEFVKVKNGVRGIEHFAYCINLKDGTTDSQVRIFFMPENFYSFRVKNREFIDTRDEVLTELGFD